MMKRRVGGLTRSGNVEVSGRHCRGDGAGEMRSRTEKDSISRWGSRIGYLRLGRLLNFLGSVSQVRRYHPSFGC